VRYRRAFRPVTKIKVPDELRIAGSVVVQKQDVVWYFTFRFDAIDVQRIDMYARIISVYIRRKVPNAQYFDRF